MGKGEDVRGAGRVEGMVVAVPLPKRSLNYWHEGVWASVCMRAPVWCLRRRGLGKGTKPAGLISLCSPSHPPSQFEKPTRGRSSPDSTLPSPGSWGLGIARWQCPPRDLSGEQDFAWPLLLNLCPARCHVPTYFTSVKN